MVLAGERWADAVANNNVMDVIFVDFRKPFGKVPRYGLLFNLSTQGLSNALLRWIVDFLKGRTFFMGDARYRSGLQVVVGGVSQCSVLGP